MTEQPVTDSMARKTALVVASVLLAVAAWNFYRGRMVVFIVTGACGVALVLMGLFIPSLARSFHKAWMRLAVVLGYINSRILISLMFYGMITPFGIFSRLFGRDVLNRRGQPLESYWIARQRTRQTKEQFERMF